VEEVLEEKIKSGEWAVGYQLPSEQELAALFDVSTITVKRAVIDLVNKGNLFRQRGKGTFVSGSENELNINTIFSLSTEVEEEHPHELISFSIEEPGSEIAKKMDLVSDSKVIMLKRLKIENSEPQVLEYTYLPFSKCPDLTPNDINNELIYNILKRKYNIVLGRAKLFIKPYIAQNEKSELLKVESGTPVFEWERFTYTNQEEIIEYSKFYIRPDKRTYCTEVKF
jgi:GntR family transcriptional regulator